jgi:CRISPR-associated protein Cas1
MPLSKGVSPVKSLVVSGYGVRLRFRNGLIIAESKNGKQEVPVADVEQLVLATSGIWLSSKLIRRLIEYGVDVVFLDSRGLPVGRVYPPFINKTVETRRAQYASIATSRAIHAMREFIYGKIYNQAMVLKKYYYNTKIEELRDSIGKLMDLASRARSIEAPLEETRDKLRSIEAEASRIYWPNFALLTPRELGFPGRSQDSGDPVNTLINYSYGILYSECWKAIVLSGLDPYAGFIHVDRSGKPVLVYDFIEMFRFSADLVVLHLLRRGWRPVVNSGLLDYESRRRVIEALNKFLDETKTSYIDETPITLRQVFKKASYSLASYLRGDGVFEAFTYRW